MTPTQIFGIANARIISPDGKAIDMTVRTDGGDIPFLYVRGDDAPLAVLVRAYLDAHPDTTFAIYQAPKPAPKTKVIKGGDND